MTIKYVLEEIKQLVVLKRNSGEIRGDSGLGLIGVNEQ